MPPRPSSLSRIQGPMRAPIIGAARCLPFAVCRRLILILQGGGCEQLADSLQSIRKAHRPRTSCLARSIALTACGDLLHWNRCFSFLSRIRPRGCSNASTISTKRVETRSDYHPGILHLGHPYLGSHYLFRLLRAGQTG